MPEPVGRPLVLVVDDEEGIRNLLTDILSDLGYETISASDGDAAIAAMRAASRAPTLAIIDLVMPGKGGVETLAKPYKIDELTKTIDRAMAKMAGK